jgi:cysteine desulfurase family protein
MAYFDNASTTYPKPDEVYNFMNMFYRKSGGNAGRGTYELARSAGEIIIDTRKRLQTLLHCPAKQVIFEPTTTISLNMIIQGLLHTGIKNIYISPFEHNAVTRTLHHFVKTGDVRVSELAVDESLEYNLQRIKYQFDLHKPELIIISHVSNTIGLIAPIKEIFSLAKQYKSITVVDMAQSAGLVDLNVGMDIIDFAVFAGHKTLYGPTGISGFVMNPSVKLPSILFGGTGYDSANQDMPDSLPEQYEMGTPNIIGIAGLNAALKWINKKTITELFHREHENRYRLLELLSSYDFIRIVGNSLKGRYVGIVSCLIDGVSSDSAGNIFNEQGIAVRTGLHCAPLAHRFLKTYPAGTIRFSVNYFTNNDDFVQLKNALNYIEKNL